MEEQKIAQHMDTKKSSLSSSELKELTSKSGDDLLSHN
jgi:hypothetical protein